MKLHDYQHVGIQFLQNNPRAGLFLDMGLGKTATVLAALTPKHLPALVIAPKRVAENVWGHERNLWRPDLSISIAAGSPGFRKAALEADADLIVLGRDNLNDLAPVRNKFNTLVLDELSSFKNKSSVRWKVANAMAKRTEHVWGLTGTPVPNGYLGLFPQIMLLDGGKRLDTALTRYRNRFFYPGARLPNGVVIEWILRDGADEEIKHLIEDLCLYMEANGRIEIPPVSYVTHSFDLPHDVLTFYHQFKRTMVGELKGLGLNITASSAGVLGNRLSQISAGFIYEKDELTGERTGQTITVHDERISLVRDLIEQSTSPVLVAYRYKEEERQLLKIPGAKSIRWDGVIDDWNRGEVSILVAHPASAGHGLNLQYGGHTLIWMSPVWDLEQYEQMCARLNRQGQKHPVVIHRIMANKTIDSIIYDRLEGKADVQQDLLNHLASPL